MDDLDSSFPPTAVPVCDSDLVTQPRAASLLGQALSAVKDLGLANQIRGSFQHLPLDCIYEVYQNFTYVCHIVRA